MCQESSRRGGETAGGRGTPGDVSIGAHRSRSRGRIKAMAQGERPLRSGAFSDAVVDTVASVAEHVHPVAVQ
jgi:hypothetical protein